MVELCDVRRTQGWVLSWTCNGFELWKEIWLAICKRYMTFSPYVRAEVQGGEYLHVDGWRGTTTQTKLDMAGIYFP